MQLCLARQTKTGVSDPIGLSLTEEEYAEVYANHDKKLNCDDELRDRIYILTAGHVGSIKTMFRYVSVKVSKHGHCHAKCLCVG